MLDRVFLLDVQVPTHMRTLGESTGSLAFEMAVDDLVYAFGPDPVEFRR